MKCIEIKCRYYKEHDFYGSYFACGCTDGFQGFKKDKTIKCIINDAIEEQESKLISLKKYIKHIKENQ